LVRGDDDHHKRTSDADEPPHALTRRCTRPARADRQAADATAGWPFDRSLNPWKRAVLLFGEHP
jgi:hypothetical protein